MNALVLSFRIVYAFFGDLGLVCLECFDVVLIYFGAYFSKTISSKIVFIYSCWVLTVTYNLAACYYVCYTLPSMF